MSKPLSISLALLFVGLQLATLFHGASYGFAAHDHSARTVTAFDTPVFDVFGRGTSEPKQRHTPEPFCDLDLFCDKLDKLVHAVLPNPLTIEFDARASSPNPSELIASKRKHAGARGPPSSLHS